MLTSFRATYCELKLWVRTSLGMWYSTYSNCCQGTRFVFLRKCNKRKWFKRQWLSRCKKKKVSIYIQIGKKGRIGLFYMQVSICVNSCNVRFKIKLLWIVQGLAYLTLWEFTKLSSLKAVVTCSVPVIDCCLSFLQALLVTVICYRKGIHLEQGNWVFVAFWSSFLTKPKGK